MCDLVSGVHLRLQILEVCGPDSKDATCRGCKIKLIVRSCDQSLNLTLMNLNDFVDLSCMIIYEIKKSIISRNKDRVGLLSLS